MVPANHASAAQDGVYTEISELLRLRFAAGDLNLAVAKPSRAQMSAEAPTRFRGRGMEFEEVRVYQAGDDIRSIDWRVTARTQTPHTKLYREERERPMLVAVDQRATMFFGSRRCFKSVSAARLAALLAWTALHNGDRVGGLVFGNRDHRDIRPRRSKHSVLELIHQVDAYNHQLKSPLTRERQVSLATMLMDTARLAKPGSAVFLISDFSDFRSQQQPDRDDCAEALYRLGRHTDVTLLHVHDPLEQALPAMGLLSVSDGERRSQIASQNANVRQQFNLRFEQQLAALRERCRSLRVSLYAFSTDQDEVQFLRQIYAARKRR